MQSSVAQAELEIRQVRVEVGTRHLSVKISGEGTPIVLFHSLLADQSSFDPIVPALATTHQVVVLGLPGFADSDHVGPDLESIADHIAQAIQALDLKEKPILLGNGYGGFIALVAAIRHPDLASRLVLADCGAAFSEPGREAFRGMSATSREKGLIAIADVAMRRLFAPEFQQKNPALVEDRKKRFLSIDPTTFHGACEALATLDVRDKLAAVRVPTLILVGEQDEATPPVMSSELHAGMPGSRLVVLKGCAHVPQLQAPEAFMQAIAEFIAH
jgi:3-oxoadipate enol-lactonase